MKEPEGKEGRPGPLCQQFGLVILEQVVSVEFRHDFGKSQIRHAGLFEELLLQHSRTGKLGEKNELRSRSEGGLLLGDTTAATT